MSVADYQSDNIAVLQENPEISLGDLLALLKPRVMSLVVFTGVVGLLLAPGDLHPVLAIVAILCIAVGAGAAGAINMWYDRDIDAVMTRTRNRPIPDGRVTPGTALGLGVTLGISSVSLMALAVNGIAAALLAFTILFYSVIYTILLKRRTSQNIVIGGAAGAFPPMIGWAAVAGDITFASFIMFAIIFLWTPPHFWALALYKCGDYSKANVPMLPVVSGRRATAWNIIGYSILLCPVSLAPCFIGLSGAVYGISASLLSLTLVVLSFGILKEDASNEKAARIVFPFSILYLFLIFVFLLIDHFFMVPFSRLL